MRRENPLCTDCRADTIPQRSATYHDGNAEETPNKGRRQWTQGFMQVLGFLIKVMKGFLQLRTQIWEVGYHTEFADCLRNHEPASATLVVRHVKLFDCTMVTTLLLFITGAHTTIASNPCHKDGSESSTGPHAVGARFCNVH